MYVQIPGEDLMAEPVSALPPPPLKDEPIPWPQKTGTKSIAVQEPTDNQEEPVLDRLSREARSALERVQDAKDRLVTRSKRRMHRLSQQHPMRVVMGVAIACLLAGAALRIWRSSHE
jgi:hypothetical protein